MKRWRVLDWVEGAEAQKIRSNRLDPLLRKLEAVQISYQVRGALFTAVHSAMHAVMMDAYAAGVTGVPVSEARLCVTCTTELRWDPWLKSWVDRFRRERIMPGQAKYGVDWEAVPHIHRPKPGEMSSDE